MVFPLVWPGTPDEAEALTRAIHRYCTSCADGDHCAPDRQHRCAAHAMLLQDEPALKRLVFVRRSAGRYWHAEMDDEGVPA